MFRGRLLVQGAFLVGLGMSFVPVLSGCGDSAVTGTAPSASKEEEKKKQDEATQKAFEEFQKTSKTNKKKR